jgi:hypothetical protein
VSHIAETAWIPEQEGTPSPRCRWGGDVFLAHRYTYGEWLEPFLPELAPGFVSAADRNFGGTLATHMEDNAMTNPDPLRTDSPVMGDHPELETDEVQRVEPVPSRDWRSPMMIAAIVALIVVVILVIWAIM